MRRRAALLCLTSVGVSWALAANAQTGASLPILLMIADARPRASFDGVRQQLAHLGYVDGHNILIRERIGGSAVPDTPTLRDPPGGSTLRAPATALRSLQVAPADT